MSDIRLMRINIKPSCSDEEREKLIEDCLKNNLEEQYVAIGWSYVYTDDGKLIEPKTFNSYEDFYNEAVKCIKERKCKVNHALNSFLYVKEGDLFWTRDLNGFAEQREKRNLVTFISGMLEQLFRLMLIKLDLKCLVRSKHLSIDRMVELLTSFLMK